MGAGMQTTGDQRPAAQPGTPRCPLVRVTGFLVEDGRLLLVRERLRERAHWNLPGGRPEAGESIESALVREMREETGLDIEVGELLYVTDRFKSLGNQIVDLSFSVRRIGGDFSQRLPDDGSGETLAAVRMVPVGDLPRYGFNERLSHLVAHGFPNRGTYQGEFHSFYG